MERGPSAAFFPPTHHNFPVVSRSGFAQKQCARKGEAGLGWGGIWAKSPARAMKTDATGSIKM